MTLLNGFGSMGARPASRSLAAVILAFSLVAVSVVPSQARAAKKPSTDSREMQAREAYAAGSYKEALDFYTKLYAEKLHPTYLRNIGRCYQNLGEPDRAISSFREYLRKAKNLPAEERAEVEGYINEMEDLQKKNAAAAAAPTRPLPLAAPLAEPNPPPHLVQPQPIVAEQRSTPASAEAPFYKRTWFWALVGGVVVASTVGGLWAGGAFAAKSNNGCPAGTFCVGP
jgi:tetratricopeptide (TPR) repeat protein